MLLLGNDPTIGPSFSLANRLQRALWSVVSALLFRPSPRPMHRWRAMLLRLFGAKLGSHVHVYPSAVIWAPWHLVIGEHSGVGDRAILYSMNTIRIGSYCVVSQGAHLCTGTHDIDSANFQLRADPIAIENHAWICADAFIGPGVSVSEGCVIGARAVLMRSTDRPWSVYTGNPARFLRGRNQAAGNRTIQIAATVTPASKVAA